MAIYSHMDDRGRVVILRDAQASVIAPRSDGGIHVMAGHGSAVHIPDDEIPALVSALQNYMSQRAKAITRAASNGS